MKLTSRSPEETEQAGCKLGKALKGGDVVCFYGDLGSGKTTMIKGIAEALGIAGRDITSASFTIIAEYQQGAQPFRHIDLYRLHDGADMDNAGIWDSLDHNAVSVIEWADKLGDSVPLAAIKVYMTDRGSTVREIIIEGIDEKNWDHL